MKKRLLGIVFVGILVFGCEKEYLYFEPLTLAKLEGSVSSTVIYHSPLTVSENIKQIKSIIILDISEPGDGRPGDETGADIDAIKISSALCTTAHDVVDAAENVQLDFSQSKTVFKPGFQEEPYDITFIGADPTGQFLDNSKAQLGKFYGSSYSNYLSLGRSGALCINLKEPIATNNLNLYVGEVAGNDALTALLSSKELDADSIIPILLNMFHGTCEQFYQYVVEHGVTDGFGVNHPGYYGWTDHQVKPKYSNNGNLIQVQNPNVTAKYNCPCNNTVYDTLDECLPNCDVTLGCFTNICAPIYSGDTQLCVKWQDNSDLKFKITSRANQLYWFPPLGVSVACLDENIRLQESVKKHEAGHVLINSDVENDVNQKYQNGLPSTEVGCGNNLNAAKEDLKKKILETVQKELDDIEIEIAKRSREYHDRVGKYDDIDCAKCR